METVIAEKFPLKISQTVSDQSIKGVPAEKLIQKLSFSHFVELLQIDDFVKRTFYEVECIKGTWDVRELRRQIGSLYYERSGLSQKPELLSNIVQGAIAIKNLDAIDTIKSPYTFEFLGLKSQDVVYESTLEQALIDHLEEFMLELGHGFCFEAKQKRIIIGDRYSIMQGIGSLVGTSKFKRQQQEIENLKHEKYELQADIEGLIGKISKERSEHQQETRELKAEIIKIHDWLPDASTLIKWGEYCEKIGFSKNQARDIIGMKPFRFTGKLYSNEYSQRFKANDVEVRLERGTESQSSFRLLIDRIGLSQWFKQKYREFQEAIGIKPKQTQELGKSKGIRR